MSEANGCPMAGKKRNAVAGQGTSPREWWPNRLNLAILHQHAPASNPLGPGFNYAAAFNTLDLARIKQVAAQAAPVLTVHIERRIEAE